MLSSLTFADLHPAARRFLAFSFFNVLSWQCIVGPALILFGRKIEMPATWIGMLISMLPFSAVFVALTATLVMRLGPKRLMMGAWFVRNILVLGIFLLPFALEHWGREAAWRVLLVSIGAFCLARAFGVGGWFPWLHEVVPPGQRGAFFSSEQSMVQAVSVVLIFGQGMLLTANPTIERFLLLYALGVAAGFTSLLFMARIPGGEGAPASVAIPSGRESYLGALRDRAFVRYLVAACLCLCMFTFFNASFVLFLRDGMGIADNRIMSLLAAGSAGVFFTVRKWGRFADRSGSGRAMYKAMLGHGLGALVFLTLSPGTPWCYIALWPLIVWMQMLGAAFWAAAHRAMLNKVEEHHIVGYTNLWTIGTALVMGATPIAAGKFIDAWSMSGFHACFLIAGIGEIVCASFCVRVVGDSAVRTPRPWDLINPALPLRTMARIAWISLGFDESSRNNT